jgi:hypothetical protein
MNSHVGWTTPREFSTCSAADYRQYINRFTCLAPPASGGPGGALLKWGAAVCGDGFVEEGEACDCGEALTCEGSHDPCCDALTCQLRPDATCSALDGCCDACGLRPATHVCRPRMGPCDVVELCDGQSGVCPEDFHLGTGTPCVSDGYGEGLCHGGECKSTTRQCAEVGMKVEGIEYSTCPEKEQLSKNSGKFCGVLNCADPRGAGLCKSFRLAGRLQTVEDGVPCPDPSRQCLFGTCAAPADLSPNIFWVPGKWSECASCSDVSTRSMSCMHKLHQNTSVVSSDLCPFPALPSMQQCCPHKLTKTGKMFLIVALVSLSIGGSLFGSLAWLARMARRRSNALLSVQHRRSDAPEQRMAGEHGSVNTGYDSLGEGGVPIAEVNPS